MLRRSHERERCYTAPPNGYNCARTPEVPLIAQKNETLKGSSHPSRKKALTGHDRLKNRDSATSETTMDLGYRSDGPNSFLFCTRPKGAGARKRALCCCARLAARLAANYFAQLAKHQRILIYCIATLQTHCKSLDFKKSSVW